MREDRVIALAGLLQACQAVHALATRGRCDADAEAASLASIFRIDADNTAAVFGGLGGVQQGLQALVGHIDGTRRELALSRLLLAVLRLEGRLRHERQALSALREGIEALAPDARRAEPRDRAIVARLAEIYVRILSPLPPRILVHGDPDFLGRADLVERIRALLLAAVRAAVLWRQVGGSQLRLLLRHRHYAMLARGLLSRSTLDGG